MITQDDMVTAFGEREIIDLTDRVSSQSINSAILAKAIEAATGEIESYLYAAGLVTITPTQWLKQVACDITRYRLYENQATDEVDKRYKDAIAWLTKALKTPNLLKSMGEFSVDDKPAAIRQKRTYRA